MKEYEEEVPEESQAVSNFESEGGHVVETEEVAQASEGIMGKIGDFVHSVADFFSSKAHETGEKVAGYAEDSVDKVKEVSSNVVDSVEEKAKDMFKRD